MVRDRLSRAQSVQAESTGPLLTIIQENGQTVTYRDDGSMIEFSIQYTSDTGIVQDLGGLDSIQTDNVLQVNNSESTKIGSFLEVSTTAGTIVGITAGLVFTALIAFGVYQHRSSSRRRTRNGSQEQLVVNA